MTEQSYTPGEAEVKAATDAICVTGGIKRTPCHIDIQRHCLCGDFARAALTAAAQVRQQQEVLVQAATDPAEASRDHPIRSLVWEARASLLYQDHADNHPTIHCNRFPTWSELTEEQKQKWRDRVVPIDPELSATAALAGRKGEG